MQHSPPFRNLQLSDLTLPRISHLNIPGLKSFQQFGRNRIGHQDINLRRVGKIDERIGFQFGSVAHQYHPAGDRDHLSLNLRLSKIRCAGTSVR